MSHKVYCKAIESYTGYNFMWIIQNSLEVHQVFNTFESKVKNLKTYDFSTLYTFIPLEKLKTRISELIIKSFNAQDWKFITLRNNKASWSKNIKTGVCLSCDEVINLVGWLIGNTYVTLVIKSFNNA